MGFHTDLEAERAITYVKTLRSLRRCESPSVVACAAKNEEAESENCAYLLGVMKIHVERQITVALENQPGQLASICDLLGKHAINIEAICVIDSIEQGVVRLLTSDPENCKAVLQQHGFYVIEGEVLVLDLFDRIGKLASIGTALAEARINIDYVYGSVEHAGSPLR
ncbi:MAG: hypothetical protein JO331_00680, partial [Verrucomicrobia bacterium]|nr:hypothetical protein [Verrucomicrobiota bacterium]